MSVHSQKQRETKKMGSFSINCEHFHTFLIPFFHNLFKEREKYSHEMVNFIHSHPVAEARCRRSQRL